MLFAPPPAVPAVVWLQQPNAEDIAKAEGFHGPPNNRVGHATMACYILADGRLDGCRVDDAKSDMAYAKAILALAGAYLADVHAKDAPDRAAVSVVFPRQYDSGPELLTWPTDQDVKAARPEGREGSVSLNCQVTTTGELTACWPEGDIKQEKELKSAALSLTSKYKFIPAMLKKHPVVNFISINIHFGPHMIANPTWERKPGDYDFSSAYPPLAWRSGLSGRVVLKCNVDHTGLVKNCIVQEEKPVGIGFGNAALSFTSKFKMKPPTIDGQPMDDGEVFIPISFKTDAVVSPSRPTGGLLSSGGTRVLPWAPWVKAPDAAVVAAAFPKRALAAKAFGRASLLCDIRRDGRLSGCEVNSEAPDGLDFGKAAKGLAPQFATDPAGLKGADLGHLKVALNVNFSSRMLEPPADHYIRQPNWVRTGDAGDIQSAYPAAAVKAGVFSGQAIVDCQVGPAGAPEGCKMSSETPVALGFGDAAVKVAPTMQANLWTLDGEPAPGQKIRLPMKFIYSGPPPAAAASSAGSDAKPAPPPKP